MPNPAFFKEAFDRFATSGAIGDPNGLPAYGYLRVSTDQQADEGRTGLPRQIKHVHEAALRDGYRVPWELIFADDESGFILERPALNELLSISSQPDRAAEVVMIEHLDRLSRDADWHQGYLLHLFEKKYGMEVVFWKQFGSRVERMVMGAISQDGMERSKDIMSEGKREKVKSGRILVGPNVAFGYRKVDLQGKVSPETKRNTTYGIVKEEAAIVRFIYEELGYCGNTLYKLSERLNQLHKPPRRMKYWDRHFLYELVRNPVYKGKFAAFRWHMVTEEVTDPITGRTKKVRRNKERPESEWVLVDVPAIVSEELWDAANKVLQKNKSNAKRNAKHDYLLSGLLRCAVCGRTFVGQKAHCVNKAGQVTHYNYYYKCSSKLGAPHSRNECSSLTVRQDVLENAVWYVVKRVLDNPELLLGYLDEQYSSRANQALLEKIGFIRQEIKEEEKADKKALALYNADGYTAQEYAEIHKGHKARISNLQANIAKLEKKFISKEKVEAQKRFILEMTARARAYKLGDNPPSDIKRSLIKIACDKITINQPEGKFTLEGEINGTWPIAMGKLTGNGEEDNGDDDVIACVSST